MRIRSASLHWRLLAGTMIWVIATLAIAGWLLQALFEQHLFRQFDGELSTHLEQLAANLEVAPEGTLLLVRPLSDPRLERPYSGIYWQVDRMNDSRDGLAVLRSRSLWDSELSVPMDTLADGERHAHQVSGPDGEALRMLEQVMRPAETPDHAWRLIVAADEKMLSEPLARFRQLLLTTLSLLAAGLVGAAVFQVFAGLRPLKHLRDELARLREGGQTTLSDHHPKEVQPLVDELNALLKRNTEFVDRARTQAGNLAHAVKTPLTVIANATAEENGMFADLVEAQVATARQQIDRHLALARVAASAQDKGQRCQVLPIIEGLIRVMERIHPQCHFSIELPEGSPPVFQGEAQDLQEMLGNLLDNAGKWAKSKVVIRIAGSKHCLDVDIEDDGPGIAADLQTLVLERGRRADEKMPGSGLGLSIVEDLAGIYGGHLELRNGQVSGLCVRLSLPSQG